MQSALIVHRISWLESFFRRATRVLDDWSRQHKRPGWFSREVWGNVLFNLQKSYLDGAERRMNRRAGGSYEDFIRLNDTLSESDIRAIKAHIPNLPYRPLISIIMPVYNPPADFLQQALDSVLKQLYPHWELCIADDASTDPAVKSLLAHYQEADARIKVVYREFNGHISQASNTALAMAAGEYVALMDQDDLIPPHALYHVAVEINRHPESDLIYSDEDKLNEAGERCDPYFKTDWNPDLFYSHNLITHLGVYRTCIVKSLGGFREGYEGSQDYDLALRMIARIPPAHIRHIPRIIYHWRVHAESTASAGSQSKLYAYEAAQRALTEHLAPAGARVEPGPFLGTYRVRYPIPDPPPLVSLIIPTRDRVDILWKCIESIRSKTLYPNWEMLVVDNQSEDAATLTYLEELASDPMLRIYRFDAPFNYSAINNFAVEKARGELVALLNNDVEVIEPDWLGEMVSHAMRPEIGAVGAKLLYPDGRIQHTGVILGLGGLAAHAHRFFGKEAPGYSGHARLIRAYSAVTGACLVVRKSIYEQVGGLDALNLKVAYNDVDLCLRIREAGYRNLYTPYAVLYHHESVSRGQEDTAEKQARFQSEKNYMRERWGTALDHDPYYNPNLTTASEDFTYAEGKVASSHHGYPLQLQ
jgi:glycosyltransferase involved in cell wall biosynthesis